MLCWHNVAGYKWVCEERPVLLSVCSRQSAVLSTHLRFHKLGFPGVLFLNNTQVMKETATIATNSVKLVHSLGNLQQHTKCVAFVKLKDVPFSRQGLTLSFQKISKEEEISRYLDTS